MDLITLLRRTPITFLLFLALSALSACQAPDTGFAEQATSCATPVPNDSTDDRAAIQCLLDTVGHVELEPGVYNLGLHPTAVSPRYSLIFAGGQELRGAGPATTLAFEGDCNQGEYHGLHITGDSNSVHDLAIDTSGLTDTEEQTHAIQVGPAEATSLRALWITHPERAEASGGDCIRIAGKEITGGYQLARGTQIIGVHFKECDRSGVAVQRGTDGLTLTASTFYNVGDQDLDVEMTSTGKGYAWNISNNVFLALGTPNSYFAVSISAAGIAGTEAASVVFSGNVLLGRGLHTYNLNHAVIANNVIRRTVVGDSSPSLHIVKASTDLLIHGNSITRESGVTAGVAVMFQQHNTGFPERIVFSGNQVQQDTAHYGVYLEGVRDTVIVGNRIGINYSTISGIYIGGTPTTQTDGIVVSENLVRGTGSSGVRLSGSYSGLGSVVLNGNQGLGQTYGVRCDTGSMTVVSSGNQWNSNYGCGSFGGGN